MKILLKEDKDVHDIISHFLTDKFTFEEIKIGGVNVDKAYLIKVGYRKYILKSVMEDHIEAVAHASTVTKLLEQRGFKKTPQNVAVLFSTEVAFRDMNGMFWELEKYKEGVHISNQDLTKDHIWDLAKTLSDLHRTFLNKTKPESLQIDMEIPYIKMFDDEQHAKTMEALDLLEKQTIPEEDRSLLEKYRGNYVDVRNFIYKKLEKTDESFFQKSIIHRDLNKGNILFSEKPPKVVVILDWDTVMWGNVIQDLAYLTSHYFMKDDLTNKEVDGVNIRLFLDAYNKFIHLNRQEIDFYVTLVDVLKARATRWSVKRYAELLKGKNDALEHNLPPDPILIEKFENHRISLHKVLENWIKNREECLDLFQEVLKTVFI